MMIICLTAGRLVSWSSRAKLLATFFMAPSNAGMSPTVIVSTRASIMLRLGPTVIMPPFDCPHSHWSVMFH